ncbi:MAG: hypothetical protein HQL06_15865 [Nitrospirae bacterium]|nr:hypothetical protein [Nitrospirota bacterium]
MTFEDVMMGFEAIGKDFERLRMESEERGKELKEVMNGFETMRKDTEARIKESEKHQKNSKR